MGSGLTRRAVVLSKIQTGEGVDAVPVAALNALLISDLSFNPNGEMIERNHLRDSLSPLPHRMGRKLWEATFGFELKAGAAVGARPEWSPFARAAGMSETITGAVVTSIRTAALKWTLSPGAGGTEIFYVDLVAGGDPSLADPQIVRENGTDMNRNTVATALSRGQFFYGDVDTLGFNTIYVRLSDGADPDSKALGYVETVASATNIVYTFRDTAHEFASTYIYPDGLEIKCIDSLFDWTGITFNAGAVANVATRLMSKYATPTDVALPTGINDTHLPPTAQSMAFTIDGYAVGTIPSFSVNFANQLTERRDLNSANGLKGIRYTGRAPTGTLLIEQETVATFPFFTRWENATEMAWSATMGTVGQRLTFSGPAVQFTSVRSADIGGIRGLDVGLKFTAPSTTKEFTITLD